MAVATGRYKYCSVRCRSQADQYRQFRKAAKRRRKTRLSNAASVPYRDRDIFTRDGWRCRLCGRPTQHDQRVPHPKAPTIDHIVPLSCGGDDTPSNVQCAHFLCNSLKGDRLGGQLLLIG